MSADFYKLLPSFSDFSQITDDRLFHAVPEDWTIFLTDVKGSTKAIEEGRYKDVNTVGAASIVCAQNAMCGLDFPYVFGGDGATMLVPPQHIEDVERELASLKNLSSGRFGLELRVGRVGMSEVRRLGGRVEVAKFELVSGKCIAVFRGGGLSLAEKKIKEERERYEVAGKSDSSADLSGLSCRWQPIRNKNGMILSLLVAARGEKQVETYQKIIQGLGRIFGGAIEQANPLNLDALVYKSFARCFLDERRYQARTLSKEFLSRIFGIVICVLTFKFKIRLFDPRHYIGAMKTHCDYRKFDDMLRMIVDCSDGQKREIETFFSEMHRRGEIFYGLHSSENALMTCYVHSIDDGQHIHFIDGGNGGYALAAKQLKEQLKAQPSTAVKAA